MSASSAPMVEQFLTNAHDQLALHQDMCRSLTRQGVANTALPGNDTLIAFAFLADHGRAQVESELQAYWQELTLRGLAHGEISGYSTPCLRLLLMIAPASLGLADLQSRMQTEVAQPAPADVFRCASRVDDLIWGQRVRLDYHAEGADYLLITPARIFARQPLLLHFGGDSVRGSVEIPGDDGEVAFTVLGRDGQLFRHTTVFELRDADGPNRSVA